MRRYRGVWLMSVLLSVVALHVWAAEEAVKPAAAPAGQPGQKRPLTIAVLGFAAGDNLPKDMGANLSTLLAVYLSTKTDVQMVEREELVKTLEEQGLGLSGMVSAADAVKVGKLVGANVLVTGRAFSLGGNDMTIVVKIIGAETGRVYGRVVKSQGPQDVDAAVTQLAAMVADVLTQYEKSFVTPTVDDKARAERIKKALGDQKLPQVTVLITERHQGPILIDPAAETEINFYLQECGVKTLDRDPALRKTWAAQFQKDGLAAKLPEDMKQETDVVIVGEAISELGLLKGGLISCKARVELKAVDTVSGEVLAIDRETDAGVDVAESTAAKTAIQKASATLAERVIPLMVQKWNKAQADRAAAAKAQPVAK
jgi:hypothetical protein